MPEPGKPGSIGTGELAQVDPDERETLPDVFASELPHLFDYCRALLGQDAEAARTARSVLNSAQPLQQDPGRLRAWLFSLGRGQALDSRPPGGDEPSYMPLALIAASSQQTDNGVLRAFSALSDSDREILDLVYRHGIRAANLPEVLGIPAAEAYRRLAIAEEEFVSLVAEPPGSDGSSVRDAGTKLEDIAALPLAALPAAAGSERQPEDLLAPPFEGAAPRRAVSRRRPLFAAAALTLVAAILGGVVLFGAPGHGASNGAGVLARGGASQATQRAGTHGALSHQSGHYPAPAHPVHLGPVATPTPMPEPTSGSAGPGIARFAVTVNPVPCPAGTKANFRWHYAANGSPGGWSGPATHACPGSLTMGPQAMGNLQVTPGTTLQAGYDVSVPGNKVSLTMTVSAAQITFAISCMSKAAPSAPTLTVPLQTRTYQITSDQWFPSGDQSSPLVYQGSVPVPALCGPGGAISLAKGGTFTATLG
jgi:DNA-directed RNA polymerase specialized sigma24 family protein